MTLSHNREIIIKTNGWHLMALSYNHKMLAVSILRYYIIIVRFLHKMIIKTNGWHLIALSYNHKILP